MNLNWLKRPVAAASVLVFILISGCSAMNMASSASPKTEHSGSVQLQTASSTETAASQAAVSESPEASYSEELTTKAPSTTPSPSATASASASASLSLNPNLKLPLPSLIQIAPTLDPSYTVASFLKNMKDLADKGRVFNSEYAVETTTIDDVIAVWGNPNKSEYIQDAKGTYDTYTNKHVVYGFNKGDQIFEVRSTNPELGALTMSQVKSQYGANNYSKNVSGQIILGYVINAKYKMLLVFDTSAGASDPPLLHYSVLYPAGTVNQMAGDPGRQW
ncbi:MAG: YjgB family protein [Eubacteriales bacterium]